MFLCRLATRFKTGPSLAIIDLTSIRAIFFDAVGTLLHPTEPVISTYREAALRQGIDIEEDSIRSRIREAFQRQDAIDLANDWRTNESREVERWRTIVRETLKELPRPDEAFFELWEWFQKPEAWRTVAETAEVLVQLRERGMILGMASNFDARLAKVVADKPELEPLVEHLVISSLAGWRKPAPEFYSEMIAVAGQEARHILYVGDDPLNDYEGARAAGLRSLLFTPISNGDDCETIESLLQLL